MSDQKLKIVELNKGTSQKGNPFQIARVKLSSGEVGQIFLDADKTFIVGQELTYHVGVDRRWNVAVIID